MPCVTVRGVSFQFFLFFPPDTNGDGVLDEQELEALFTKEVKRNHLLAI